MILGIDEAGRGSAIGDLVIAGLCCKEKDFQKLKNLRVKDSKLLSPKKREELYNILIENFETKIVKLSPQEIDLASKIFPSFASSAEISAAFLLIPCSTFKTLKYLSIKFFIFSAFLLVL